jgi:RNA polymerase sigma-70 factor (ECF subfamily)
MIETSVARSEAEGFAPAAGRDLAELGDAELVALARRGHEAAVRALVRRHNRRLFRVARGVVRDDADAEDVVQEAYVRAFTNLTSFRGEAGFATWLTRIALNAALGRLRRRRPRADLAEIGEAGPDDGRVVAFPSPPPPDPEAEAGRAQVRTLLEPLIDGLPPFLRLVVILRDVEGMSTAETAEHLGIRPETVKTRLHRGRRLLRSGLLARLGGGFGDLYPFDGARCAGMADRVVERLAEGREPRA